MDEPPGDKNPQDSAVKRKWNANFGRLWSSVNVSLIPLKIVNFCWHGAYASLFPYITVYMKALGLTIRETAIIFSILPVAEVAAPVLGGIIADKTGRYKAVYLTALLFCAVCTMSFHFIPIISPQCNRGIVSVTCESSEYFMKFPKNCPPSVNGSFSLEIGDCQLLCSGITSDDLIHPFSQCYNGTCSGSNRPTLRILAHYASEEDCRLNVTSVEDSSSNNLLNSTCDSGGWMNKYPSCSMRCYVNKLDNITFPCDPSDEIRYLTIVLCLIMNIALQFFSAICFSMLDATNIVMVSKHGSHFGRQRMWACVGQAVFSPLTGYLVDHFSKEWGYTDYSIAFYVFGVLTVAEAIAVYSLDLSAPPLPKHFFGNLRQLVSSPRLNFFFVIVFCLGICWGYLESFLFWYLIDLGSPNYLLGLTITIGAISSIPFLYCSEWFIKNIGHNNLLIIALLFYVVRYVGYSVMVNPWWCIVYEAMEFATYHFMWVTVATYSGIVAPKGMLATVEGFAGGLHFGLARGVASLTGGFLEQGVGKRGTFRVIAGAAALVAAVYAAANFWLSRRDCQTANGNVSDKLPMKVMDARNSKETAEYA